MRRFLSLVAMLLLGVMAFGQTRTVTGTIRDATGNPVPFATVTEAGTKNASRADENGRFSIRTSENAQLLVSAAGFQAQTLASNASSNVVLARTEGQLAEVVVTTAQGVRRDKRTLGYSAPTIGNADLTRGQTTSALNGLQGKVSGVNITSTAGAAGSSSRIVIRGGSSITGSNQALLVVDGIPIDNSSIIGGGSLSSVDFGNRGNDINPEDIQSVTVLKGPAAAALYGSRASNGALIITTKSGKQGAEKMEITFSSSNSFSSVLKLPDLQNEYGQGYYTNIDAAGN